MIYLDDHLVKSITLVKFGNYSFYFIFFSSIVNVAFLWKHFLNCVTPLKNTIMWADDRSLLYYSQYKCLKSCSDHWDWRIGGFTWNHSTNLLTNLKLIMDYLVPDKLHLILCLSNIIRSYSKQYTRTAGNYPTPTCKNMKKVNIWDYKRSQSKKGQSTLSWEVMKA